jgi:hypothetical protein
MALPRLAICAAMSMVVIGCDMRLVDNVSLDDQLGTAPCEPQEVIVEGLENMTAESLHLLSKPYPKHVWGIEGGVTARLRCDKHCAAAKNPGFGCRIDVLKDNQKIQGPRPKAPDPGTFSGLSLKSPTRR